MHRRALLLEVQSGRLLRPARPRVRARPAGPAAEAAAGIAGASRSVGPGTERPFSHARCCSVQPPLLSLSRRGPGTDAVHALAADHRTRCQRDLRGLSVLLWRLSFLVRALNPPARVPAN